MNEKTSELQAGTSQMIGKPMSTSFILMMLGKISMQIDPSIKDSNAAIKATVLLDVKAARMRYSVNSTTQDINKTLSQIEQTLDQLGESEITQGIQQNYLQHFNPLKAEAGDRAHEKAELLKQINEFSKQLKAEAQSIAKGQQSPAALKEQLEGLQKKQRELQQKVEKLGTNEKALHARLKKTHKDIYQTAVSTAGIVPKGIERPELN